MWLTAYSHFLQFIPRELWWQIERRRRRHRSGLPPGVSAARRSVARVYFLNVDVSDRSFCALLLYSRGEFTIVVYNDGVGAADWPVR